MLDYNPVAFIKHSSFKFNLILNLDQPSPAQIFQRSRY